MHRENNVERIADLDRARARELERLQALSGICGSISRCGFAAAACFCAYHGIRYGAVFFAILSFTGGITISFGGRHGSR